VTVRVYALTTSRLVPPIAGVQLRAVRVGMLTALVADARRVPAPTPANLRRYHHTIAAIADALPAALPARFGTVMAEAELAIIVHARAKSLTAALRHVHGAVQMTTRLIQEGAEQGTGGRGRRAGQSRPQSGVAYLRSRAAQEHDVPGFDSVRAAVQHWIRDERVERQGDIVSVYHLVPRRAAAAYARVAKERIAAAGLRAVVSGPFPPYAFSSW
jgi:hypothetical protein